MIRLIAELSSLQTVIADLTSANTTLDAEVNDLMRRVASGEYNPETERCLELRANPAAKVHAVRNAQLETLKTENEALLERLRESANDAVPRESYERLKREKEDLEQGHAKRLLRLKEVRNPSIVANAADLWQQVQRIPRGRLLPPWLEDQV